MEGITYLRHSDLYGQRVSFVTLKKTLRQFNLTNILFSLSRINVLLCRQYILDRSQKKMREVQQLLAMNYLNDDTYYSKLADKYDAYFNPVFSRQQMLYLFRLCILECSVSGPLNPDDNNDNKFKLGECCLIASDHLTSPKEDKSISEGRDTTRTRHLGYQLAPIVELYNPVQLKNALVRSEIMYGEILGSQQFKQKLSAQLADFDINQKFLDATGITINQYREFTVAVLSNYLGIEDKDIFDDSSKLIFNRHRFLSTSKVKQSDFDSYLNLESRSIPQFKISITRAVFDSV